MPANQKYLSQSPWLKYGKLSAALFGSFIAAIAVHLALAAWFDLIIVVGASMFSFFILWVGLMLIAYWIRRVWQVWGLLAVLIVLSVVAIYASPFF